MSQIETLLLFVLGFSLATLIALFVGRMVWSAALKVGARRMQKQVPSSLVGLQTERDRLRAEYAMLSQRLTAKLDTVKLRMAEQMAEVSRHRNRLEEMAQSLAARDAEISSLKEKLAASAADMATAATLQDELRKSLTQRDAELAALRKDHAALQVMYDSVQIAGLGASASPEPVLDHPEPVRSGEAHDDGLKSRIDRLSEMARNVARDRRAGVLDDTVIIAPPPPPLEALPEPSDPLVLEKLEAAERETDDLRKELEQLDAEWSKRLSEPPAPEADAPAPPAAPPAVANVISLANRIRDLRKGITQN